MLRTRILNNVPVVVVAVFPCFGTLGYNKSSSLSSDSYKGRLVSASYAATNCVGDFTDILMRDLSLLQANVEAKVLAVPFFALDKTLL